MRAPYWMRADVFAIGVLSSCTNGSPGNSPIDLLAKDLQSYGTLEIPSTLTATYRLCPPTAKGGSVIVSLPLKFNSRVHLEKSSVTAMQDGTWSVTVPEPELGEVLLPSALADSMISPVFLNIHAQEEAAGKELEAWPPFARAIAERLIGSENGSLGYVRALVSTLIMQSSRSVDTKDHKLRVVITSNKKNTAEPPMDGHDVCPNSFVMVNGMSLYQEVNGKLADITPTNHPTVINPPKNPPSGAPILGTAYAVPSQIPEAKALLKLKIANGTRALPGSYSWAVAFTVEDPKHVYHEYCGGVLLTAQTVLTAAHCDVRQGHKVIIGATDLSDVSGLHGEALSVLADPSAADIAPGNGVAALYDADLKIVHLSTASKKSVAPISFDDVPAGEAYTAIGWGYTESGDSAESLMEAKLTNNTLDACKDKFASNIAAAPHIWGITKRMICAGGGATATCDGDSGGPLIYGSHVVGLVSFGDICLNGNQSPSLFTKLKCFKSFVQPGSKPSPEGCNE